MLKLIAACSGLALLLAAAPQASAATARVRCEVRTDKRPPRVRVKVDGQNLAPGTYTATVWNITRGGSATTEPGKEAVATAGVRDVDLDFDSTAQADDNDSVISSNFARPGDRVGARVDLVGGTANPVATATTTCTH
jgi:hypothetical protein